MGNTNKEEVKTETAQVVVPEGMFSIGWRYTKKSFRAVMLVLSLVGATLLFENYNGTINHVWFHWHKNGVALYGWTMGLFQKEGRNETIYDRTPYGRGRIVPGRMDGMRRPTLPQQSPQMGETTTRLGPKLLPRSIQSQYPTLQLPGSRLLY